MRVIAGKAKGKTLKLVPGKGTRPVTDRVKGALFNILSWRVPGCRFLDLFAGTGSIGIEALSRGAREVVFVEKASQAVRVVLENLNRAGLADHARVIHDDAYRFVAQKGSHMSDAQPFDVIYVAPPQYQDLWSQALLALDTSSLLAPDSIVVAQIFPKEYRPLPLQRMVLTDRRTYGSTMLCFYQPHTDATPPA